MAGIYGNKALMAKLDSRSHSDTRTASSSKLLRREVGPKPRRSSRELSLKLHRLVEQAHDPGDLQLLDRKRFRAGLDIDDKCRSKVLIWDAIGAHSNPPRRRLFSGSALIIGKRASLRGGG